MKLIIACPKCRCQPNESWTWPCEFCGAEWNVFESEGECPNCKGMQECTICLPDQKGCGSSTPHQEWYGFEKDLATELWDDDLHRQFRREEFYG